jgi:hypothetical protein
VVIDVVIWPLAQLSGLSGLGHHREAGAGIAFTGRARRGTPERHGAKPLAVSVCLQVVRPAAWLYAGLRRAQ